MIVANPGLPDTGGRAGDNIFPMIPNVSRHLAARTDHTIPRRSDPIRKEHHSGLKHVYHNIAERIVELVVPYKSPSRA